MITIALCLDNTNSDISHSDLSTRAIVYIDYIFSGQHLRGHSTNNRTNLRLIPEQLDAAKAERLRDPRPETPETPRGDHVVGVLRMRRTKGKVSRMSV
jgi:hypothetical protein